jgi:hypothetical protein
MSKTLVRRIVQFALTALPVVLALGGSIPNIGKWT